MIKRYFLLALIASHFFMVSKGQNLYAMYYNQNDFGVRQFSVSSGNYFNIWKNTSQNYVVKTDSLFNVLWAKAYSPDAYLAAVGAENCLYMISSDTSVVKTDSSGNVLWTRKFSMPLLTRSGITGNWLGKCELSCVFSLGDTIFVALNQPESFWKFASIVALDTAGNFLWAVGDSLRQFTVTAINKSASGVFWFSGNVASGNAFNKRAGIVKVSGNGSAQFNRLLPTMYGNGNVLSFHSLPDSTSIVVTNSYTTGGEGINVIRINEVGDTLWDNSYSMDTIPRHEYVFGAAYDNAENIYLMCEVHNRFLMRIDTSGNVMLVKGWRNVLNYQPYSFNGLNYINGNLIWENQYYNGNIRNSIIEKLDTSGNNLCLGSDTTFSVYKFSYQLFNTPNDSTWCSWNYSPAIGFCSDSNVAASTFDDYCNLLIVQQNESQELFSVFPNPITSGSFKLKIPSLKQSDFILTLSDISGRVIIHEQITTSPGINFKEIDMGELLAGVYVLTLSGSEGSASIKLVKE
ncbi:MAG TPA: T9SS type A sorting domain-containing protein [Chitinophagaceae bacterium]|nr:T9SS type A sorting domain-containing protein [Chitinophagaceae bacterium]